MIYMIIKELNSKDSKIKQNMKNYIFKMTFIFIEL